MTLKYENTAEVGDTIRSMDFEPFADRKPCFIEGIVMHKDARIGAYFVKATRSVFRGEEETDRVGCEFMVPYEFGMDWDGRVTKLNPQA